MESWNDTSMNRSVNRQTIRWQLFRESVNCFNSRFFIVSTEGFSLSSRDSKSTKQVVWRCHISFKAFYRQTMEKWICIFINYRLIWQLFSRLTACSIKHQKTSVKNIINIVKHIVTSSNVLSNHRKLLKLQQSKKRNISEKCLTFVSLWLDKIT